MIKPMALEHIFMLMGLNTRAFGKTIFKMVGGRRPGQTALSTMEIIKREKNMAMVKESSSKMKIIY
jgi:hypothetical protein